MNKLNFEEILNRSALIKKTGQTQFTGKTRFEAPQVQKLSGHAGNRLRNDEISEECRLYSQLCRSPPNLSL